MRIEAELPKESYFYYRHVDDVSDTQWGEYWFRYPDCFWPAALTLFLDESPTSRSSFSVAIDFVLPCRSSLPFSFL
jgi:hypothetical protein